MKVIFEIANYGLLDEICEDYGFAKCQVIDTGTIFEYVPKYAVTDFRVTLSTFDGDEHFDVKAPTAQDAEDMVMAMFEQNDDKYRLLLMQLSLYRVGPKGDEE